MKNIIQNLQESLSKLLKKGRNAFGRNALQNLKHNIAYYAKTKPK